VTTGETSDVNARRVRAGETTIKTKDGNVLIGSYIES
jgi:hypothetical protein